ncbi:hypothetical protein NUBL13799_44410 [Klebsiella pneumoniae]|jgi:hypothetical protein|nr:putative IS2 ORF [Klebsiella pneumoniae KCTC 2242]AJC03874.1 hypothetical protein P243_1792 [Klebsiella pneumoniae subsp. pneumoniae 1158]EPF43470.1 putative IS2 ORF [Klebsiella pneumoniae subsp. pneumoniae CIP 52.145 = B5055]CCN30521.1 putative IS2 ORF [Klebsiella pneumoniae subsp. pneumoniae Ecl8]BCU16431.1 hypothetical protein MAKP3_16550 [Klebsiella pneumoniae]BDP19203.1 hypothetical protein TUM9839_16600 [Klebsiella pneumoniae subsp. pneumoniae]
MLTHDPIDSFGVNNCDAFIFRLSAQQRPYPPVAVGRNFTDNSMDTVQCFRIVGLTLASAILPVSRAVGYRMKLRT